MKNKIRLVLLLTSFSALADTSGWSSIKTPRGTDLEIKITKSINPDARVLIIAPGQSCNSKGPLFETIERESIKNDLNIVRFEWSYCSASSSNKSPSTDYSFEISDMDFVINYSKTQLQKTNSDLFISGKSLGSIIAFQIFKANNELKSLSLLTPVCSSSTDQDGNPSPTTLDVTNTSYPELQAESRSILMISGNSDPLCNHMILDNFKYKVGPNFDISYVEGNHSFTITNSDGSINQRESQNNLRNISNNMVQWFISQK